MSKKSFSRSDRVAGLIHQELAEMLIRHPEKTAFKGVTITTVKVSPDLRHAKIFVTFFEETDITSAIKNLNQETKFLRHLLAQKINLRITPELLFIYDESIRYGQKLSALIDEAVASDEARKKEKN